MSKTLRTFTVQFTVTLDTDAPPKVCKDFIKFEVGATGSFDPDGTDLGERDLRSSDIGAFLVEER